MDRPFCLHLDARCFFPPVVDVPPHRASKSWRPQKGSKRIPVEFGNSTSTDASCGYIYQEIIRPITKLVLLRCLKAQPNAAHRALASLALPSVRAQLLPALAEPTKPPLFITQNVDGLSPRALASLSEQLSPTELKLASERLIEMHGSIHKTRCLQCKAIKPTPDCPALRTAEDGPGERERAIPVEALPRCGGPQWDGSNRYGRCGGLLRPAVVWFGEAPEGMGEIAKELNWTDMLVVVGTSSTVSLRVRYVWVVGAC